MRLIHIFHESGPRLILLWSYVGSAIMWRKNIVIIACHDGLQCKAKNQLLLFVSINNDTLYCLASLVSDCCCLTDCEMLVCNDSVVFVRLFLRPSFLKCFISD